METEANFISSTFGNLKRSDWLLASISVSEYLAGLVGWEVVKGIEERTETGETVR